MGRKSFSPSGVLQGDVVALVARRAEMRSMPWNSPMPWFTWTTKSPGVSSTKLSIAALFAVPIGPRDPPLAAEDLRLLDGKDLLLRQREAG